MTTPELAILAVLAGSKEPLAWFRIELRLSIEPLVARTDVRDLLGSLQVQGFVEEIGDRWAITASGRVALGDVRIPQPISPVEREFRAALPPEITVELSCVPYFSAISRRFPFAGSKIDWRAVPGARVHTASVVSVAEAIARRILGSEPLDDDSPVVVVIDSGFEGAYRMRLSDLRAHLR